MAQYELLVYNHHWTQDLSLRVTAYERHQARDLDIDPVYIRVAEDEIEHIWSNTLRTDQVTLASLRRRLNEIKRIEASRPRIELPPFSPLLGYVLS